MDDEKKRKPKMISVRVIKAAPDNATVEFVKDKLIQRATIPNNVIENGKVDEAVLDFGIPYGIPWENVKLSASSIDLANALRTSGVWTCDDAIKNPNKIVSALQAVYGVDLAALTKYARENK